MTVRQREYLSSRIRNIANSKIRAIQEVLTPVPTENELFSREGKLYDQKTIRQNFSELTSNYHVDYNKLLYSNYQEVIKKREALNNVYSNNKSILAIRKKMQELEDAAMFLKEPEVIQMLKEFEQN